MTLSELRLRLEAGLAGHVLSDLAQEVVTGPADEESVARVLVSLVAKELASLWEGPVTASEANDLTRRFGQPLRDVLLAIESGRASAPATDALARAYLAWRFES